jgi:hypothetical protein
MRVSGAFHRLNSRQNDQTRQKGKNRVDGRHGKIRLEVLAEISDRKHLTLGNKPILATFSGLLSGPVFSSCVLTIQNRPNHRGMYPTAAKALGRCC